MSTLRALLCAVVAIVAIQLAPGLARAADLDVGPAPLPAAERAEAPADYLRRLAVLQMIRATFNVIATDEVEPELERVARTLSPAGPSESQLARLDRDLLAEGSYYLVSLRYLTESGGAAWPGDRPESSYAYDALVTLDALLDRLVEAVEARADPLAVFVEAQGVLALTEGYRSVPPRMDRFRDRDAMVKRVLARFGPTAST